MKMATISTFELLVKRIAPLVPGNPGGVNEAFRRVVQGYFLLIANPNERPIRFRMRAHIPTLSVDSPFPETARELVSGNPSTRNHVFTYDITGGPVSGQVAFDSMDFFGTFCEGSKDIYSTPTLLLPPCQTAAVKLLPDITSPVIDLADPQLEVRGYIDLVQVVSIEFSQGEGGLVQVRFEEPDPVDLLITPEIRGTFLDNDYPTPGGGSLDFDQLAYSLPTATGAASMTVREAVNPFFIFPPEELSAAVPSLQGRVDYTGKFLLDDNSLQQLARYLEEAKRKQPKLRIELSAAREVLERELNSQADDLHRFREDG